MIRRLHQGRYDAPPDAKFQPGSGPPPFPSPKQEMLSIIDEGTLDGAGWPIMIDLMRLIVIINVGKPRIDPLYLKRAKAQSVFVTDVLGFTAPEPVRGVILLS
jgi:hypothetical protein